jgi:MFS family permease
MGHYFVNKKVKAASFISYGLIVMAVTHTFTHVFGGIHTSIFSLLREEFSLSLRQLGLMAAIPPLCQAIFTIPTGLVSDRYGSKKMLLVSFTIAVLGAVLASQANNPLIFILAVSMVYVNNTIYHPASYSYTANNFTEEDRPKAFGLHGAGGTLGHASGPLAVSILIGMMALKWRQVYLVLTVPIFLGIVMILFLKEERDDQDATNEIITNDKKEQSHTIFTTSMVMFLAFRSFSSLGRSIVSSFLVLYLQDIRGLSIALASFIFSSQQLSGLVTAPIGGYLGFKYGELRFLAATNAVSLLCFSLAFFSKDVTLFIILFLIYGIFNTLGMASRNSIVADLTPRESRGLGYSLYFLPNSIIGALAPALAGLVAEIYGFNAIFYISIIAFTLAWVILKFTVKIE